MSKGDRTRAKILEKAAPLFNQQGYAGASLSDIMTATGLKKGGIYRHFDSKETLALEAFDYAFETVSRSLMQQLKGVDDPVAKLLAFVAAFRNIIVAPALPGGCPVLNTAVDSDDGSPAMRRRVQEAMNRWQRLIRHLLQQGIERGEIKAETDPDRTAVVLIAGLEGGVMLSKLYDDPVFIDHVVNHLEMYIRNELRS